MRPRIAVVYPGDPLSAASWSGTPAGLIAGLRSHGADPVAIDAHPRAAVATAAQAALIPLYLRRAFPNPGRVLALADMGPELGTLRAATATRRLRMIGRLDAVVTIGTDFPLRCEAPLATLQDRTIAQALATRYPRWLAMPPHALTVLRRRERDAWERAAAVCTLTPWPAQEITAAGVDPGKVHVIGIGSNAKPVDVERDWSVPRFLFVGGEWERKGGPGLVRAFAELQHAQPAARLDVVGCSPSVAAEGVTVHGWIPRGQVARLIASATCLTVPSTVEPAGIAYVEAAASGVPSIGTSVGGAAWVIGKGGRVVSPGDHAALVAALTELSDPHRARHLGDRARMRAATLTWETAARRLLNALDL